MAVYIMAALVPWIIIGVQRGLGMAAMGSLTVWLDAPVEN